MTTPSVSDLTESIQLDLAEVGLESSLQTP